jgi:hypothetical protein
MRALPEPAPEKSAVAGDGVNRGRAGYIAALSVLGVIVLAIVAYIGVTLSGKKSGGGGNPAASATPDPSTPAPYTTYPGVDAQGCKNEACVFIDNGSDCRPFEFLEADMALVVPTPIPVINYLQQLWSQDADAVVPAPGANFSASSNTPLTEAQVLQVMVLFYDNLDPSFAGRVLVRSEFTFSPPDSPNPLGMSITARVATMEPPRAPLGCTGGACRDDRATFWFQKDAMLIAVAAGQPAYNAYCSA